MTAAPAGSALPPLPAARPPPAAAARGFPVLMEARVPWSLVLLCQPVLHPVSAKMGARLIHQPRYALPVNTGEERNVPLPNVAPFSPSSTSPVLAPRPR